MDPGRITELIWSGSIPEPSSDIAIQESSPSQQKSTSIRAAPAVMLLSIKVGNRGLDRIAERSKGLDQGGGVWLDDLEIVNRSYMPADRKSHFLRTRYQISSGFDLRVAEVAV